ncbi:MAG: hypothetical protein GWP91_08180 [Rhodobacterales bacterium]|nr:hypothetical protein [Rhodobacterales bacterium]
MKGIIRHPASWTAAEVMISIFIVFSLFGYYSLLTAERAMAENGDRQMGRGNTAWWLNRKSTPQDVSLEDEASRQHAKRLVRDPPKPVVLEEAGELIRSWTYEPVDLQSFKGVT